MKKSHLLFCLIAFSTFSCKKSYTCQCNTSWTYKTTSGGFNTQTYSGGNSPYKEKLTEKQAKSACNVEQINTESDFINGITDNGKYPLKTGESIKTECSIILK